MSKSNFIDLVDKREASFFFLSDLVGVVLSSDVVTGTVVSVTGQKLEEILKNSPQSL